MKKYLVAVIGIMSILAMSLISGCAKDIGVDSGNVPANTDTRDADNATAPEEKITVNGVHVKAGEEVSFTGRTVLHEGTFVQTQLYADEKPEAWWPAGKYIQVQDGEWQITVRLGESGAPWSLSTDAEYLFKVWEKDDTSTIATFGFDLAGPPARSELGQ